MTKTYVDVPLCDDEPVCEAWQKKVALAHTATEDDEPALATVLHFLEHLAHPRCTTDPAWSLARIVAICERESGTTANPDASDLADVPMMVDRLTVMWLLDSLTRFFPRSDWRVTGNNAAYWLRDILSKEAT